MGLQAGRTAAAGLIMAAGLGAAFGQAIPATGKWTTTGLADYPVNRSEHQGEEINGKFYVVGGQCDCGGGGPTIDLYIYNIATNTWSKGKDMPAVRHHVATAKHGGKFYVFGGVNQTLSSWPWDRGEVNAWVYDPGTNEWTVLRDMPERVGAGDAEAVGDKIYVAGGILEGENQARTRTLEYDIATNTWTKKADMKAAREHFRMASIGRKIYAAAGRHNHQDVKIFEVYDVDANTWTALKDLPTTRGGVAVGAINNRIYVMGGEGANASIGLFEEVEEFDPATNTWKRMADMTHPRHGMAGIEYDGKFWLVAGANPFGHNPIKNMHHFQPPAYATDIIHPQDGIRTLSISPATGALTLSLPYQAFVKLSFFDAQGAEKGAADAGLLAPGTHRLGSVPAGAGFVRAVVQGAGGGPKGRETRSARLP